MEDFEESGGPNPKRQRLEQGKNEDSLDLLGEYEALELIEFDPQGSLSWKAPGNPLRPWPGFLRNILTIN